jgi:hypothetical protein
VCFGDGIKGLKNSHMHGMTLYEYTVLLLLGITILIWFRNYTFLISLTPFFNTDPFLLFKILLSEGALIFGSIQIQPLTN